MGYFFNKISPQFSIPLFLPALAKEFPPPDVLQKKL